MKKLLIISLLIITSCSNPTSQEPIKKDLPKIEITHKIFSFSISDNHIQGFSGDEMVFDTLDTGETIVKTMAQVGDSVKTLLTFSERSYTDIRMEYSHNGNRVGARCHSAPGYPKGFTIGCSFFLSEEMYEAIKAL